MPYLAHSVRRQRVRRQFTNKGIVKVEVFKRRCAGLRRLSCLRALCNARRCCQATQPEGGPPRRVRYRHHHASCSKRLQHGSGQRDLYGGTR